MGNVKSIENAVESLPPTELAEFRRWFAEFDGKAWDKQIEQDAASGKLDQLAAEALAACRTAPTLGRTVAASAILCSVTHPR